VIKGHNVNAARIAAAHSPPETAKPLSDMTTTHPSTQAGTSQCGKILAALKSEIREWVAMPTLVSASGSFNVHSRISDLRKQGHQIEQVCVQRHNEKHSFYRLVA